MSRFSINPGKGNRAPSFDEANEPLLVIDLQELGMWLSAGVRRGDENCRLFDQRVDPIVVELAAEVGVADLDILSPSPHSRFQEV